MSVPEEVWLAALDGQWELCGSDRLRGIVPEGLQLTANTWGSDTARFTLRRNPGAVYPDLSAFTPVEIWINGSRKWKGRIKETPTSDGADGQISVECEGLQYHLDDDVYERVYVHQRISDWQDMRTSRLAALNDLVSAPQVSTDQSGVAAIAWPANTAFIVGTSAGLFLDLGPDSLAVSISIDYTSSNNDGNRFAYCRGLANPPADPAAATVNDAAFTGQAINALGTSGTVRGTFATPSRYVGIYIYFGSVAATPTADVYLKLSGIRVFTNDAWRSTDTSILKASDIFSDALDKATVLLSSDKSGIQATIFNIPEFALGEAKSPREAMDAADAYHAQQKKVDVDGRVIYKPKPAAPIFEVGEWAGVEFQDASANSGEEIYTDVLVQGTGPDGQPLRVRRSQGQQSYAVISAISSPAPSNPSFATDTSGWTPSTGTAITRDTAVFDSTPASGRWDRGGGALNIGDNLAGAFTGTFLAGVTYRLDLRLRVNAGSAQFTAQFGTASDNGSTVVNATTTFATYSVSWTPKITVSSGVTLSFIVSGGFFVYVDSLSLFTSQTTLIERRGFRRQKILPVQSAMVDAEGTQIGNVWLANHRTTPFKGALKATGHGAVRRVLGGQGVHPSELLLNTQELMRFSHRLDPDTGGHGRDGRIASVTYDHATESAQVAIDDQRDSLEALLARLAVVTGSG